MAQLVRRSATSLKVFDRIHDKTSACCCHARPVAVGRTPRPACWPLRKQSSYLVSDHPAIVSLEYRRSDNGPAFMFIDAGERSFARSDFAGAALARRDVIGTPLAQWAVEVVDPVWLQAPISPRSRVMYGGGLTEQWSWRASTLRQPRYGDLRGLRLPPHVPRLIARPLGGRREADHELILMTTEEAAYHEVSAYTLTRGDRTFIHQHVVDAWAAQTAHATSKPIGVFFALVGLYLHIEQGFTGREVQRAHTQLASRPEPWSIDRLPVARGTITVLDVLAACEGAARDGMIHEWARSVWEAYSDSRESVIALLRRRGIIR